MRGFTVVVLAVLAALAFLYRSEAAAIDEPSPAAADESKAATSLLDVDAGGEHSSEAQRSARQYGYGWSYGWGQPWSYYSNSWGRPWGGYGWGAWGNYGGGWGRPWNYWG